MWGAIWVGVFEFEAVGVAMSQHRVTQRKPLTAVAVRQLSTPGRYSDGNGLYLVVDPTGGRRWLLRIVVQRRRRDIGLGSARLVPLSTARETAIEMRRIARDGGDPLAERRKRRTLAPTFKEAAKTVHAETVTSWRNQRHATSWLTTLETYAFPLIGDRPVDQIDTADVQKVLAPIWLTKSETARRVRQRMRTVFDWARVTHGLKGANPVDGVERGLPKQTDRGEHHAAMPYAEVPGFVAQLRQRSTDNPALLAFELLILTACRTNEVLLAAWEEIDLGEATWTIPAVRMKAHETHVVPLSRRALAILAEMKALAGDTGPGVSGPPARQAAVQHGVPDDAAAHGAGRHRAWLPLVVPRLGGGRDGVPELRGREGAGARHREQGRGGVSARRSAQETARADGRLGGLLRWRAGQAEGRARQSATEAATSLEEFPMMMTHIPPFDDGHVRLGRAAELIARERDDATADDIMDAFKRAIFAGELDHDNAGLQMEIEVPRCTLPPDVAAMTVRPRALYGVNRSTVASVLLCADALPGERADWERLFDIAVPDRDEELPYVTLARIPFRDYPETGRRELEALLVSKHEARRLARGAAHAAAVAGAEGPAAQAGMAARRAAGARAASRASRLAEEATGVRSLDAGAARVSGGRAALGRHDTARHGSDSGWGIGVTVLVTAILSSIGAASATFRTRCVRGPPRHACT